jgi:hypothetical protein
MFSGQWKVFMFGGQWKILMLGDPSKVPMFDSQWKVSMFGGQWMILMLSDPSKVPMFDGQWKEKKKHIFTSSHLPPTNFTSTLIISFNFKVFFYHGFGPLLRISFLFLDL